MPKEEVGKVKHFYNKISVAVIELSAPLKVGDTISIEGHEKAVEQAVDSMQVEHEQVQEAKKGQAIGMKINEAVKEGDVVYKVTPE